MRIKEEQQRLIGPHNTMRQMLPFVVLELPTLLSWLCESSSKIAPTLASEWDLTTISTIFFTACLFSPLRRQSGYSMDSGCRHGIKLKVGLQELPCLYLLTPPSLDVLSPVYPSVSHWHLTGSHCLSLQGKVRCKL